MSRHPHKMSIIEVVIISIELTPPLSKTSGTVTHTKISVQDNPIYAIVVSCQHIVVVGCKTVQHDSTPPPESKRSLPCTTLYFRLLRRSHFFRAKSRKKTRFLLLIRNTFLPCMIILFSTW